MSFTCQRPFSITINPPVPPGGTDVPLDQAIYSTNLGAIAGVRGQYLYIFDATTGALVTTKRIVDDFLYAEASIVEVGTFLYVGLWRRIHNPNDFPGWHGDVFRITPGTLAVAALGLGGSISGSGHGFSNLITDGTFIYGTTGYAGTGTGSGIFQFNPLNAVATYVEETLQDVRNLVDLVWDGTNNVVWEAYGGGPEVQGIYAPSFPSVQDNVVTITPPFICGACYCSANNKLYCVGMTNSILKVDIDVAVATLPGAFSGCTATSLAVLGASAKPARIKYNYASLGGDGLIYVPTWSGDTVEVFNPSTDTVSAIKSGFTSPIDVVFTPAGKKFAVQNSAVGLKEVV